MSKSKFKEWYKKNSADWNRQRRERYAKDKEYRETVLERNREHRSERKEEAQAEALVEKQAQKARVRDRWKVVEIDGETFYSIGSVAQVLRVSVQAVRLWERQGLIAPPKRRTDDKNGKGQRLYSLEEIESLRKVLKAQGRLPDVDPTEERTVRHYDRTVRYSDGTVRTEKVYTIGVLAEKVERTVVTLEHHEREKKLPATTLRGSSVRRRFYTMPMIEVVRRAFEAQPAPRGDEAWKEFHERVYSGWAKLKVIGAKLVDDAA